MIKHDSEDLKSYTLEELISTAKSLANTLRRVREELLKRKKVILAEEGWRDFDILPPTDTLVDLIDEAGVVGRGEFRMIQGHTFCSSTLDDPPVMWRPSTAKQQMIVVGSKTPH